MTLSEIAQQAKPGDRFAVDGCYESYFGDDGQLWPWGNANRMPLRKGLLSSKKWEFTYRPKRCPHCGEVLEEP